MSSMQFRREPSGWYGRWKFCLFEIMDWLQQLNLVICSVSHELYDARFQFQCAWWFPFKTSHSLIIAKGQRDSKESPRNKSSRNDRSLPKLCALVWNSKFGCFTWNIFCFDWFDGFGTWRISLGDSFAVVTHDFCWSYFFLSMFVNSVSDVWKWRNFEPAVMKEHFFWTTFLEFLSSSHPIFFQLKALSIPILHVWYKPTI